MNAKLSTEIALENKVYASDPTFFIGLRRSAWIETLVFFVIVSVIDIFFGNGNRFFNTEPHPYWIIVVLMAAQYGTSEAILATVLATLFLYSGPLPPQKFHEDQFEYLTYLLFNPILWFGSSIILGEIRVRQIKDRDDLKKLYFDSNKREEAITKAYQSLKLVKENLEVHLAGQLRTSITAYEALKSIENLSSDEILYKLQDLIYTLLKPEKFSVYIHKSEGLNLSTQYGWKEDSPFLKLIKSNTDLYEELVGRQRIVCVINSNDEKILGSEGVIAGPIIDVSSGEVIGVLKIEELGFIELNLTNLETFRVLCQWIGTAYSNAKNYEFAKEHSMINQENLWLSYNFFKKQSDFLTSLAKRINFDLSLLIISIGNFRDLPLNIQKQASITLKEIIKNNLRKVDQAFDYEYSGHEFAILLPNTPKENVHIVVDRINSHLLKEEIQMAQYSFTVKELNTKTT